MLAIFNYISVTIYGLFIMLFLCDIKTSRKNIVVGVVSIVFISLLNLIVYLTFDMSMCYRVYPVTTHLPLLIVFIFFYKTSTIEAIFALMTAYMLTTPRKFIGDLIGMAFNNNKDIVIVAQIIISIPLLIIIYIYLKPYVIIMLNQYKKESRFFVISPIIYYIMSYITTVYTDIIYRIEMNVIGFMATIIILLCYYFLLIYYKEITEKLNLKYEQNILKVQVESIRTEICVIREKEFETAAYRHEMRHHFLAILSMMGDGKISEAKNYAQDLSDIFVGSSQTYYTDNVVTNAILGAYMEMAKKRELDISCKTFVPKDLNVDEIEFCVILSNLLENAVQHASGRLNVLIIQNKDQLCVNIENNYNGKIQKDKNGDYVTTNPNGSGIGLKNVKAIVDKCKGIMVINDNNNIFKVQVAINN